MQMPASSLPLNVSHAPRVPPDREQPPPAVEPSAPLARLAAVIQHAGHLLPAQGPITVFIHHNTLHAFEDLHFDEAVQRAAQLFRCEPYLSEERYRAELGRGRIRFADLQTVLRRDLGARAGAPVARLGSRLELQTAMLQYPLRCGPTPELLWFVAETDALRRVRPDAPPAVRNRLLAETRRWVMRDLRNGREPAPAETTPASAASLAGLLERFGVARIEVWDEPVWEAVLLQALWRICCDGVASVPAAPPSAAARLRRHRDVLLQATGADADLLVHDLLIRFCAAFLDQGLAHWPLPDREAGFCRAFAVLYGQAGGPPDRWLRGLAAELAPLAAGTVSPLASIAQSLQVLGVGEEEWDDYISATLLALGGWAGITRFLEERSDRAVHPIPAGSLVEFLAIRLILDRLALAETARQGDIRLPLHVWRTALARADQPAANSGEQRAFALFQLAQVLGWTPADLHRQSAAEWTALVREVEAFSSLERRRIFHRAYERRFYTQTLDALALHDRRPEPATPRFQALFCIDDREESLRRHVEELAPDAVTYGIAGFYFVSMYYRGAADAHFVPLCPIVVQPQHWVVEQAAHAPAAAALPHRTQARRALGLASHQVHVGTRTFARGALLSAAVGVLASIPLVARTLYPRLTARLRSALRRMVLDPRPTRLQLERREPTPGPSAGHVGFSLEELTAIAERVLRDTGLTANFARVVLTLGHGSTTMNNPHESAQDCGACGGARGGPNGRAIAQILNDPRVRARLQARGLDVPATTVFIGGMHNTTDESITFYDLDRVPASHHAEFAAIRALIETAGDRDAHERCRRFQSAPLTLSFAAARQHVEARAEDLAQVRPEWGHATNAACIVGRRERTRGLFLDRRVFLNSYDPTQDDADATILTRILQAAVPVCAGISLEYYFSYVDNTGFGAGTKLPHNIAALLGVMDGAASDLRTGLPWQTVEIHEPIRLLFVIETTPALMLRIMDRNPLIGRLIRHEWVRLACLDPHAPALQIFLEGRFQPYEPTAAALPHAASSVDWYRGWRDHLDFAEIGN